MKLTMREDTEERAIDVPDDLGRARVRAEFDAMGFTRRKEWVLAVQDAKRPQAREKRIADCVAAMRSRG